MKEITIIYSDGSFVNAMRENPKFVKFKNTNICTHNRKKNINKEEKSVIKSKSPLQISSKDDGVIKREKRGKSEHKYFSRMNAKALVYYFYTIFHTLFSCVEEEGE